MKRKRSSSNTKSQKKRTKLLEAPTQHPTTALLRQCYLHVLSLRQYLVTRLPTSSKKRRRNIAHYGNGQSDDHELALLLDNAIIGTSQGTRGDTSDSIGKDITVFTQQLSEASILSNATQGALKQSEIVDFSIWQLFRRHTGSHRPAHQLCHGYQRHLGNESALQPVPGVPGVYASCSNPHVQTLKEHPWSDLPGLLGSHAESVISDMLIDCGVFIPIGDETNLSQVSGKPMFEIKPIQRVQGDHPPDFDTAGGRSLHVSKKRGLSDIRFVRHRMLYAKPLLSARGGLRYGLGHIHAFNRSSDSDDEDETIHLMKYMFPRQFGLHNVFTSDTDLKDTAQPFKDYTLREKEIARASHNWRQKRKRTDGHVISSSQVPPVPRRLRGLVVSMFTRARKRHAGCHYHALLQHYCPPKPDTGRSTEQAMQMASSSTQVSAFCRSAVLRVFSSALWGGGDGNKNWRVISRCIDRFIQVRRFETMSLHEVMQGISINEMHWLAPPEIDPANKISSTDYAKRKEIVAELLYYIFDSFLIPLLRGCFYITESTAHRNELFYFRHDVWQAMSAPALSLLKDTMMEECSPAAVKKLLAKRALGVSHVRLLPKERGMRPIINLRRRVQTLQRGQMVLGRSINSILTPAFSVLNCEKAAHPKLLASALFSIDDIFPRLQAFRDTLHRHGHGQSPLYFGKVDVQACFDTIPQKRLMSLVTTLVKAEDYAVTKYARGNLAGKHNEETRSFGAKPSWRFLTKASRKASEPTSDAKAEVIAGRSRCLLVDGVVQKTEHRSVVLNLLKEHVEANLVKIGRSVHRQKKGIPQGSIVSSLLCSYIYGELESEVLGFLDDGQSLLLRLIDDFLVISTSQVQVELFMQAMHKGVPEFGVQVKTEKSRTNFHLLVDNKPIPQIASSSTDFPYCGYGIDTRTLDVSRDMDRCRASNIADSITVEYSRLTGQSFSRKILNALKLQMHAMLLETRYNSLQTVLSNLYHCFYEVAQKSYHYIQSLPSDKRPTSKLVIRTVDDVIKLAVALTKGLGRPSNSRPKYECCVSSVQARWLAYTAFNVVFRRRQTRHAVLLAWMGEQLEMPGLRAQSKVLLPVAERYRR